MSRDSYSDTEQRPTLSGMNPRALPPRAIVAGDVVSLSCGRCHFPVVAVSLSSVRRYLPPAAALVPAPLLAAQVSELVRSTGAVILCGSPTCAGEG